MPVEEFITTVYCLIDDLVKELFPVPLRLRGFPPKLTDSEAITMEVVGEWLGHHKDTEIWKYFTRHWRHLFPDIPSRSAFVKQAANLWHVKQRLQIRIVQMMHADNADIHLIDGFPIDVVVRTRAPQSRIFKAEAGYGYCASKDKKFYGFQGHLLVEARGIPVGFTLTAANVDERDAAYDMLGTISGLLLGDKGYIRPEFKADCQELGIDLQTPLRKNMQDERPKSFVKLVLRVRRRIETVIGQLTERFEIEKCRCRDRWHMTSRIARKLLAHNIGSYLNIIAGRPAIQFENLISED